jgi:hypothetical protein
MVAARSKEMYATEAKERMSEGGREAGRGRPQQGPANLPDPIKGDARDKAGKAAGVSGRSVNEAMIFSNTTQRRDPNANR